MAVAEGGLRGEVRDTAGSRTHRRLVRKLGHQGVELRFCYEAGPCGYAGILPSFEHKRLI